MDSILIAIGTSFVVGISVLVALRQGRGKPKESVCKYPRKFTGHVEELTKDGGSRLIQQSLHGPARFTLSLVIPAFNEARRLRGMLDDALPVIRSKAAGKHFSAEIILVDDGSKDGTSAEYAEFVKSSPQACPRISFKLLKLVRNRGKGGAVCEGILASAGESILFADADGSTDFAAVEKFESIIASASKKPVLICGSRAASQSAQEKALVRRSLVRWLLMRAFHAFLSIFGVRSVKDTQCGFKMMNRAAARMIVPWIHISGWIFDVEMILIAEGKGVSVHEVPVPWKEMGGTKLSLAIDSMKMARDLLRIRFNYISGLWKYK